MIYRVVWDFDENDPDISYKIQAIETLLISHRDRHNLVYLPRSLIKNLINRTSESLVSTLVEVGELSREVKQVFDELSIIVDVRFDKLDFVGNANIDNQSVIEVSYDKFLTSVRASPATMIPENDIDYELYSLIGRAYVKSKSHLNFGINLGKNCGYGSHTYRVYSDFKEDDKFALCVVDSDKKYPGSQKGSTAGAFCESDFSVKGTVEARILNVREAESLIPPNVIEKCILDGDYQKESVDAYQKIIDLDNVSNGEFRKYFDHKDGIELKQALQPNMKFFWKQFFKDERLINIKECYKTEGCDDCGSCIKIHGLGPKILENSLESMNSSNLRRVLSELPPSLVGEWSTIGKSVFSWGCTPLSRRARSS
ncbi:hypothetical protein [Vibrio sp. WXL103]|uniref:hypothetical protein n=1 Tax=Vibrio sp. WXL103 TaxID=3450710 RepID=UPI003EC8283C